MLSCYFERKNCRHSVKSQNYYRNKNPHILEWISKTRWNRNKIQNKAFLTYLATKLNLKVEKDSMDSSWTIRIMVSFCRNDLYVAFSTCTLHYFNALLPLEREHMSITFENSSKRIRTIVEPVPLKYNIRCKLIGFADEEIALSHLGIPNS